MAASGTMLPPATHGVKHIGHVAKVSIPGRPGAPRPAGGAWCSLDWSPLDRKEAMGIDPIAAYRSYSAAWSQDADPQTRGKLLREAWSEGGEFFDEETPDGVVGRDALSAYIAATHEELPGLVVTETGEPQLLGNRIRVPWVATQGGTQMYTGTDFLEFDEDGRICRLTMFYDSTPE